MANYSISTQFAGYGHRKVTLHTWHKGVRKERSFITNDTELTDMLSSDKKTEVLRAERTCRRKAIAANKY